VPAGPGAGMSAERTLPTSPRALFDFLSDLENHWLLADRFVEVIELDRDGADQPARGGTVRIRGPLGLRRTVVTRVVEVDPPARIAGTAALAPDGALARDATLACVSWTLQPDGGGTRVRLAASLERASLRDRLLLAAGGRAWMQRRFARILETLDAMAA
jgi:uncharacterized protein YndB with AHSA1/START domain